MVRRVFTGLMLTLLLVAALPLVPGTTVRATTEYTVGLVVPAESSDVFYTAIQLGAEEAAADLDVTLVTESGEVELETVQSLLDQGVDALVISPVEGELSAEVAALVALADVPVIVAGAELNTEALVEQGVVSAVLPDNEQGGTLAASLLCDKMNNAGTVLALVASNDVAEARHEGFIDAMDAQCADVTVEAVDVADLDRSDITDAVLEALDENSDIAGVVAYDDEVTLAASDAVFIARLGASITVVGFDASDDVLAALESGYLAAVVSPVGWLVGSESVAAAVSYLDNDEIEDIVTVNMGVLDLDSVASFRDGPGEGDGPGEDSDPRLGDFSDGPGSGAVEDGPGSGSVEDGPGSGSVEDGPGSGSVEDGPGSGSVEDGPGSGSVEDGPGSGSVEDGPGSGSVEDSGSDGSSD